MSRSDFDIIVIGAGIAGMSAGAVMAKEACKKVLVLEKDSRIGGRLMGFNYPAGQWHIDVGLHLTELGDAGDCNRVIERVGKKIDWSRDSGILQIYKNGKWMGVTEVLTEEDIRSLKEQLRGIVSMDDHEIEAWDNRSLQEWLDQQKLTGGLKEFYQYYAMCVATIPEARDISAGEVLYIAKNNLVRKRNIGLGAYPIGGMVSLVKPLQEVIEEGGGEVRLDETVDEVTLKDGVVTGVELARRSSPYTDEYHVPDMEFIPCEKVICALPIYQLEYILNFSNPVFPRWWVKRIRDIRNEVTGLIGYMIGLSKPVIDKASFFSCLKTRHTRLPFQAAAASVFDFSVAPAGKQLLHTDIVCEYEQASDKFERKKILRLLMEDLKEMFPGIEDLIEWKIPYFVAGCDGLARKPGLVGAYKPDLTVPGIKGLYFAGDTYRARGLAMSSAALCGVLCAERIMNEPKG